VNTHAKRKHENRDSSSNIIRIFQVKEDELGRACSTNEGKRKAYKILLGKPEGKTPLETKT
jgi:hypothetical protein